MLGQYTVREVIERVQSLYSKGIKSKDSRLSSQHIYSVVCGVRADILVQRMAKKQSIEEWCYQYITVKIEEYKHPNSGTTFYRSSIPLPLPILGLSDSVIHNVYNTDLTIKYHTSTMEDSRYLRDRKYTGNTPFVYFKGGYLYTVNSLAKYVTVKGLFNDPIAASRYNDTCDVCKDNQDFIFPIDGRSLRMIIDITAERLVAVFLQLEGDTISNAKDDSGGQIQRKAQETQEDAE